MKLRLSISIVFTMAAIALLAALVSACGDSGSSTSTQAAANAMPDPCALFTKADAESVLGQPVQAPNKSEQEGTASCSYMTSGQNERIANLIIVKPCSMADYMNYAEGPMAQPIAGIGMHASWDKTTLLVHSKSGDTCVYAAGGGNPPGSDPADDKPALEQAKKVATSVLERLEGGDSGHGANRRR